MTAISPCPLATNITATAYISKNISSKQKVFLSGLLYSLGRGFSYTAIGFILYFGASKFHIARFFNHKSDNYSNQGALVLGALTFFLPCGFTQAMQLYAISTGSFFQEQWLWDYLL